MLPMTRARKEWLFRAVAVLMGLGVVLGVETALRLAGFGHDTRFFVRDEVDGRRVYRDNPEFGLTFFTPEQARTPQPFLFPVRKETNTCRIFILGESAAMGDPDSAFGLGRVLRVLLEERFPSVRFEVINTAMTAINSHAIVRIAKEAASKQGDLWVIYAGNNEVCGPFGAGTVFGAKAPPLPVIHAILAARSSRMGQAGQRLLRSFSGREPGRLEWKGLAMFMDQQVSHDDERLNRVYHHFEANLRSTLDQARKAGTAAIVCSMATDLKDSPPFASRINPALTFEERKSWTNSLSAGAEAETRELWEDAARDYTMASKIDPGHAELRFRMARAHEKLGRTAEAKEAYLQARDLDTLRFRADSRLVDITRKLATDKNNRDVHFLDGQAAIAPENGIPGENEFWDHVHLTFVGNYRLALAVAVQAEPIIRAKFAASTNGTVPTIEHCARRLGWNEWSERRLLEDMRKRLGQPPFSMQLDAPKRDEKLRVRISGLNKAVTAEGQRAAIGQLRAAMEQWPGDPLLTEKLATALASAGDYSGAIAAFAPVLRNFGHVAEAHEKAAALYLQARHPKEAEAEFRVLLRMAPRSITAHCGLAQALADQEDYAGAERQFREAVILDKTSALPWHGLAALYMRQNDRPKALAAYAEAVRLRPDWAKARLDYGTLLLREKRLEDAIRELRAARDSDSEMGEARLVLGMALEASGQLPAALQEYTRAVQLRPDSAIARKRFAELSQYLEAAGEGKAQSQPRIP